MRPRSSDYARLCPTNDPINFFGQSSCELAGTGPDKQLFLLCLGDDNKMDTEKLINCVFERKPLWDQKCKLYHNRDISRTLWMDVANELNLPREVVKVKWRGLRDIFRRELQKERCADIIGGKQVKSKWSYYQNMMFIKDHVTNRIPVGAIVPVEGQENDDEDESGPSDENVEDETLYLRKKKAKLSASVSGSTIRHIEQDDIQGMVECILNQPSKSNELPNGQEKLEIGSVVSAVEVDNSVYERMLSLEEKKLQQRQRHSKEMENSDYHFLMSLLPYLGNVAPNRKMLVRMKMQQIFCDEEELCRQQNINASMEQPSPSP